jgi:hypothetical protein
MPEHDLRSVGVTELQAQRAARRDDQSLSAYPGTVVPAAVRADVADAPAVGVRFDDQVVARDVDIVDEYVGIRRTTDRAPGVRGEDDLARAFRRSVADDDRQCGGRGFDLSCGHV